MIGIPDLGFSTVGTHCKMWTSLAPTNRCNRIIGWHFTKLGYSASTSAPDVHGSTKTYCENVWGRPIYQVEVKIILEWGSVKDLERHFWYLSDLFYTLCRIIALVEAQEWIWWKLQVFCKIRFTLLIILELKDTRLLCFDGIIYCLIDRCTYSKACDLSCCGHIWEYADRIMWSRATENSGISITQVLVRIFILINCIINALTVQKIIVYLHVLVPWRHALGAIAAWCACAALIGNISEWISACIMLCWLRSLSRKSICRATFCIQQKMFLMLILHLIFLTSLPTGDESIAICLSWVVLSQSLSVGAREHLGCALRTCVFHDIDLRKA
jgi:hypothetical protein